MMVPPLQLLAAALLGFGLAQLQFFWEPLWGRTTDECQSTQYVFGQVINASTHHPNGSPQQPTSSTLDPLNEPGSHRCGLPIGMSPNMSATRASAAVAEEGRGAWVRLSDKELADALTVSELASLTAETPTPGKCMLGGSNLEGRWVSSAIWPQQSPTLAFADSLRMRWSSWRGTTMLDIARTLASRKVRKIIWFITYMLMTLVRFIINTDPTDVQLSETISVQICDRWPWNCQCDGINSVSSTNCVESVR